MLRWDLTSMPFAENDDELRTAEQYLSNGHDGVLDEESHQKGDHVRYADVAY